MVLHPAEEQLPVDGSIHNQWRSQTRRAKSCKERRRLPVTGGEHWPALAGLLAPVLAGESYSFWPTFRR